MSIYVMAPALRAYVPDLAAVPGRRWGCSGHVMKLVLLGLADGANEDGTNTHPGIRVLAEFAQCHTDTAVTALAGLEHLGAIHRTAPGGPGRCATYTVNLAWLAEQSLCASDSRKAPRAGHSRASRESDSRSSRESDSRSSVLPSDTSCPAAHDDGPPQKPTTPPWVGLGITKDEWIARQWEGYYTGPSDG